MDTVDSKVKVIASNVWHYPYVFSMLLINLNGKGRKVFLNTHQTTRENTLEVARAVTKDYESNVFALHTVAMDPA